MRIDQAGRPARPAARRVSLGQTGFALPADMPHAEPDVQPAALACTASLAATVIAVTACAQSAAQRDEVAAHHGAAVLDAMSGLQLALLGGGADAARAALATVANQAKQAADPRLEAMLQAIAARAAVELARPG